jgi:hypothetical protein
VKTDVQARTARERVELAVSRRDPAMALEACDMLGRLFDAGYRVLPLAVDEPRFGGQR